MSDNKQEKFYFTAGQLIEILKSFPPDVPVVVSGYEDGYENFYPPKVVKLKHMHGQPSWNGEFDEAQDGDKETFDAVVLARIVRYG